MRLYGQLYLSLKFNFLCVLSVARNISSLNCLSRTDDSKIVSVPSNNAGIMMTPWGQTEDGLELQIGTNFVGMTKIYLLSCMQILVMSLDL